MFFVIFLKLVFFPVITDQNARKMACQSAKIGFNAYARNFERFPQNFSIKSGEQTLLIKTCSVNTFFKQNNSESPGRNFEEY